ncbi:MAG: hypothetical protein WB555_02355, partial [Candidatus Korobacteraceae bacterium]
MHSQTTAVKLTLTALAISGMFLATRAFAADIKGQVMGGGAPIAQSTVTLWAASSDAPKHLVQTKTDNDGRFEVSTAGAPEDSSLYLVAAGGIPAATKAAGNNSAILLLAVVGGKPPARVVVNEFTTIASVWTHAQLIDGMTIKGAPLQLRIAVGNVPNFVDLETGGWGGAIQDPLNSGQTPTACADLGPPAARPGDSDIVRGKVRAAIEKMRNQYPILNPLFTTVGVTLLYVRPLKAQGIDLDNLARRFVVPIIHEELKPPATSLHAIRHLSPRAL